MAKILITPQAVAQLIIVIPQSEADCGTGFLYLFNNAGLRRGMTTQDNPGYSFCINQARMIIQTKITKTSLQIVSFNR